MFGVSIKAGLISRGDITYCIHILLSNCSFTLKSMGTLRCSYLSLKFCCSSAFCFFAKMLK